MPRLHAPSKEDSRLLPPFSALPERCIHVPATDAEFAPARAALMAAPVLGFDTESKPLFHASQTDTGPHVVQLATCDQAWLLQLHHAQARALAADVMASEAICKAGFGLDHDRSALPARLGVALNNVIDLDRVFKRHGYASSVGVRAAVALVLGQNFHKSKKISTSNWAAPQLSLAQRHYAANDAHGAAMVHAALPAWEQRQPAVAERPARPARPAPEPRGPGSSSGPRGPRRAHAPREQEAPREPHVSHEQHVSHKPHEPHEPHAPRESSAPRSSPRPSRTPRLLQAPVTPGKPSPG